MFMKIITADILNHLYNEKYQGQRILAEGTGYSLGVVNRAIHELRHNGMIDNDMRLSVAANDWIQSQSPQNAIILAAGFGMRMIPINQTVPKAMIEVNGEKFIDRLIRQLNEVGITDITIVVGYMKDQLEYLIDDYGVDLVYNRDYQKKNNLHSLSIVRDRINNTYIIPCDIWCSKNPFQKHELYSWYMVSDRDDPTSNIRINRKRELVVTTGNSGKRMVGISYISGVEAETVRSRLADLDTDSNSDSFWEDSLFQNNRLIVPAKIVQDSDIVEINTYEELRELDSNSSLLRVHSIHRIAEVMNCRESQIKNICVLKKGMTNHSFIFEVNGVKYIMRIPGEGTERLINRTHEAEVFKAISGLGFCDDPIYIDPASGYKITRFLDDVRTCNPEDSDDLQKCMRLLRQFHEMKLQVPHTFDLFGQITFYESLWNGQKSIFRDYEKTKSQVLSLKAFIDNCDKEYCLTHIDAVPDNFLFYKDSGKEQLQLTDWEYAGMQDPHLDIAMFCIYSLYNKQQCDHLIDIYFDGICPAQTRTKIYCYISAGGLLWSNWCEYKRQLGVEFGEYSFRQYRFAKDYYHFACAEIEAKHR